MPGNIGRKKFPTGLNKRVPFSLRESPTPSCSSESIILHSSFSSSSTLLVYLVEFLFIMRLPYRDCINHDTIMFADESCLREYLQLLSSSLWIKTRPLPETKITRKCYNYCIACSKYLFLIQYLKKNHCRILRVARFFRVTLVEPIKKRAPLTQIEKKSTSLKYFRNVFRLGYVSMQRWRIPINCKNLSTENWTLSITSLNYGNRHYCLQELNDKTNEKSMYI